MRTVAAFALPAVFVLAACGSEPTPDPTPTPAETVAGPRTLVPSGFNDQQIGPRIVGPQGDEVESELVIDGRKVADLVSYVACPAAGEGEPRADECVPADQPEGALYTYVHRVVPAEDLAELDRPIAFRTTRPAHGFANNVGFDRAQAEAVLGEGYSIGVQQDLNALVWRVETSDGWDAGEELTFFWQSTLPPDGPAQAFAVSTENGMAMGNGPFPAAPAPATEESAGEAAASD